MADCIDLHIHSTHSDGLQTPREIVDRAVELKLKAVSIADHDAVTGVTEAAAYAEDKPLEVITGLELSAAKKDDDIHILGYLFDPANDNLVRTLDYFRQIRLQRGKKMTAKLAELGMPLDFEEILRAAGQAGVGRPHIAEALARAGYVGSYGEAFERYLYLNGPAYVPKAKLIPSEAIALIHQAGGVAVMAHPALTNRDEMIPELVASGLDGMEIYHPTHHREQRKKYRAIARKFNLIETGGSDAHHRSERYGEIGDEKVPYEYLLNMTTRWRQLTADHKH